MKKILLFIILLIPFIVNAEVKITNVELIESTEGLETEKYPSHEGLKINFNIQFSRLEDYAKYKVTINNDTEKEYEINNSTKFSEGEYVKYEFSIPEDNKIIKPNEKKDFLVTITYNKEVPADKFVNGKYIEENNMLIDLSNNEEVNPDTKVGYVVLLGAVIISIIALAIILYNHHKLYHFTLPILLLFLIPLTIYAVEKITITFETKIEIVIPEDTFMIEAGFCNPADDYYIGGLKYRVGMTFEEYLNSDYYNELPDNSKNQIQRVISATRKYKNTYEFKTCTDALKEQYPVGSSAYYDHLNECSGYGEYEPFDLNSVIEPESSVYYARDVLC